MILLNSVDGEFGSDNRTIHDDGMAQELTEVDVRAMKGRGTSGKVRSSSYSSSSALVPSSR